MARFIAIDISNNIITVELEFPSEMKDTAIAFAKNNLGERIGINKLLYLCPELRDMED